MPQNAYRGKALVRTEMSQHLLEVSNIIGEPQIYRIFYKRITLCHPTLVVTDTGNASLNQGAGQELIGIALPPHAQDVAITIDTPRIGRNDDKRPLFTSLCKIQFTADRTTGSLDCQGMHRISHIKAHKAESPLYRLGSGVVGCGITDRRRRISGRRGLQRRRISISFAAKAPLKIDCIE